MDFNESQTLKVRAELARLQQWHRTDELPKIIDLLQKAQRLAEADLAAGPVCALFAETRTRFDAVTAQAEPAAVALAMSLTPADNGRVTVTLPKLRRGIHLLTATYSGDAQLVDSASFPALVLVR